MAMLANLTITTAVSLTALPALQIGGLDNYCEAIALQANFTYGSGGTTATAYVQTSLDGGLSWCDMASFQFTTSSARSVCNLSALTAVTTPAAPTDGTLTVNTTSANAVIGNLFRVKYVTVGTYAGGTTLRIDAIVRGRLTSLT